MSLDLSPFGKALASLDRAVERSQAHPEDEEVRDSVIHRFEYSYELAWRMLKRQLEAEVPSPATLDQLNFRDLLREGAERGLVADPQAWFRYREARNITSHTYDEDKARQVYEVALDFLPAARDLLDRLRARDATP